MRGRHAQQQGLTAVGLIFWLIVFGCLVVVGLKVMPTVNEYMTIRKAVQKIAAANPATRAEAVSAFDRQRDVEYSIQSIGGKDLDIHKDNDKVVIGFAYDKEVVLYGPVSLLIHYRGDSR